MRTIKERDKKLVKIIIFDLSEVLIAGLFGIEKTLAKLIDAPEETILPYFAGERLWKLCSGDITEDVYLTQILQQQQWKIDISEIKKIIRRNFHQKVPGTEQILTRLSRKYHLVLMSDHAEEWADYIKGIHPFLQLFDKMFFSYEIKNTKRSPKSFYFVLDSLNCKPQECVFIDDSVPNVATAAALGIISIQFTTASELNNKLLEYGI